MLKIFGTNLNETDEWEDRILKELHRVAEEKFKPKEEDIPTPDFVIYMESVSKKTLENNGFHDYLFLNVDVLDLVSFQDVKFLYLGGLNMEKYVEIGHDLARYDMKYYLFINHSVFCQRNFHCNSCKGCDYKTLNAMSELINGSIATFFDRKQRMELWLERVPYIDEKRVMPFRIEYVEGLVR